MPRQVSGFVPLELLNKEHLGISSSEPDSIWMTLLQKQDRKKGKRTDFKLTLNYCKGSIHVHSFHAGRESCNLPIDLTLVWFFHNKENHVIFTQVMYDKVMCFWMSKTKPKHSYGARGQG